MSIFTEINARAEAIKAAKRQNYHPLPRAVWRDNEPERITVTTAPSGHLGSGTRSTRGKELFDTHVVIARPTEVLALLAAAGLWRYEEEPPLIELAETRHRDKYCSCCETRKPYSSFGSDKRTSDGMTLMCRACREKLRTAYWTRGKHLSRKVAQIRLTSKKAVVR